MREQRFVNAELDRFTQALNAALTLFGSDADALAGMARARLTEEERRRIDVWIREGRCGGRS